MKILGCFKIVPDLELVAQEDWAPDAGLHIDTSYVKIQWNCFDESALEMMLKLSDLSEGFDVVYELNALTIGKRQHEPFLKTLYALGYKHAARVGMEEDIIFCPEQIAEMIVNYVSRFNCQDVIVMGSQSSDGNNMKTPLLTAERLGWPCITQVTGVEPVDEKHLMVSSQTEDGTLKQVVKTPVVLAVGNAPSTYLRVPTLKAKMKLGNQPIEQLTPDQLINKEISESVELVSMESIDKSRDTVVITGDTPQEKARKLYDIYLKGRLEKL